jgi:hypothetical protein
VITLFSQQSLKEKCHKAIGAKTVAAKAAYEGLLGLGVRRGSTQTSQLWASAAEGQRAGKEMDITLKSSTSSPETDLWDSPCSGYDGKTVELKTHLFQIPKLMVRQFSLMV